jgi:ribosomal protein L16
MAPSISTGLLAQLRALALGPSILHSNRHRPPGNDARKADNCLGSLPPAGLLQRRRPLLPSPSPRTPAASRQFSTTQRNQDWLLPRRVLRSRKTHKGRPRVRIGGSTKGTTLAWGDYGIRLIGLPGRISAQQLRIARDVIKGRLRGTQYRIYHRVAADVAVYTSGNDQRMGKGKGSFDYWACRVPYGKVVFEIGGTAHEQVVREALRLAGNKLPGQWETIKKGDGPIMGSTKMDGSVTKEDLLRPVRTTPLHPLHKLPDGTRAGDAPSASA